MGWLRLAGIRWTLLFAGLAGPAHAGLSFAVDASTDGSSLSALEVGDQVVLDVTVRTTELQSLSLEASVHDYDSSIVSLDAGSSLLSTSLFSAFCAPDNSFCFGGIANLEGQTDPLEEETFGPGVRSNFFLGVTATLTADTGAIDPGVVTGATGDPQFRLVFTAIAPGTTTLRVGVDPAYGGIYFSGLPGADDSVTNAALTVTVVPEPAAALLLGLGLAGLARSRGRAGR